MRSFLTLAVAVRIAVACLLVGFVLGVYAGGIPVGPR